MQTHAVVFGFLCAVTVAAVVYVQATRVRRFVRRKILSHVGPALACFQPDESELAVAIDGLALARYVDARTLSDRIETTCVRPGAVLDRDY